MEDTGQDTTIRIGVDGTGVSAGVTSIKRSLADLGTSVKSITDKTNTEISKIGSGDLKLDAGVAKATKAVIKQTGELEKQIAAFGSTAFTGFSNISKSAEAAYVSMAGKAIPTTYIDNYLTRLKEAQLLDAKRASDAKAVAEAIAASTAKTIAVEEHYADLKRQHAAYNKSLADQEIASTKARAAALAAYATEAQNAELNLIHTGRGKSSAMLIDKGRLLGFTEAEINTYTAGLKKVEAANAAAFAAANPHIGKLKAEAEAAGTSVKGLSASLRNVPAQFTDIVVSLQGGQAPLTVLLQQGGQLRDMFGSTGGALRALGGYVMGLINPFTLAAGAAATLYMAYRSGASETEAYNKAMINTGNAAGVTASRLAGMAESVSATTGSTIGAAASALAAMTSTSGIAASQFEKVASTAVMMEKVTGVAMADTVKQFAELGKDPVTASEKLNETTHYLTAAIYEQIKALQDQGDKAGAAALAQSAYADAMKQRLPELAENLGYVERAWKGIIGAAKGAWDAMSGIGRQDSTQDRINAINQKLAGKFARSSMWDGGKALDAELAGLQKVLEFDRRIAEQEASKAKSTEASITLSKQAEKSASNEVRLQREIAQARATYAAIKNPSEQDTANYAASVSGLVKSLGEKDKAVRAGAKTISDAEKGLKLYNDLTAVATGLTSDFAEKQALLAAKFGKDGNMAEYQKGMAALIEKQPYMVEAAKAEAEAIKAIEKARTDAIKSHAKELESLGEKAQKLEDEVAMYGMSKEAIEELTTARMLDQIEVLRGFDNSAEEIARIEQVIEARKRLAAAGTAKDNKDDAAKAAKDAAAEWKKASEKIEQDITDALMRGFESGKGFAEVLRDTIENTFKTMVIRPVIQATVQGGLNAVGLGGSSSGSLLGSAGNMASIYNAAGATGSVSSLLGSSSMGALDIGGVAVGETAAGAMSAAASAVPYIAAAVAAIAIADSLFGSKGGPKSESTYGSAYGQLGDTSKKGLAGTYATGVEDAWKTLAKELEITTALKVGAQTSIDTQGDAQTIFDAYGTVNGQVVSSRAGRLGSAENVGRDEAALQAAMAEETTRLLFAALKASDLPEQYKTYLSTIGDSVADMTEAMTIVAVVDDFNDALQSLPFENLKTLSFEAAKGLIEVAGGMDVLGANLGTYYTNFYSAEEQRAQTIKTINAATTGSGLDAATATREQFRSIVEAQDLTTESGRATYAALLGVSGAMGALITESDAAAAKLAETNQGWQDQLDVLTGNETERSLALRDATDESTRAIMRQVYAQEDLRTALELTIADTQNAADDLVALYGDVVTAMLTISPPVKSLVDQWSESTAELTALTQGLADALGELPEATALDRLKTTLATLASATNGIADISEQIFGLQAGRGDQAAVNLLQGRETALFAELATSNDPGAVAAKLASTMLTRIKLQGELADKVTNDALKSQFDASTTLAQLEKTNRDKQIDAIRKQISAAETLLDVVGSMKGYLAELRFGDLSTLNPGDQLSAAQGNYNTLLSGAQGGDTKAMQDLQGGASSYLQEAQSYYGGATSQYASIFSAVTSGLEQFGATPVTDITLLQNQLDYLEKIEAASIDLQTVVTDTTDLQIEGLNSINTVLTTRQDEARQEAADNKKAVQEQIAELKAIVAGQEAQIKQQAAIYEGLMEHLTTATKALESLDNTSKQTAAAPV